METGTFTSRDTYAGRVRNIISQNRYTYAENNPVTFADPSGHKITLGTTIGNMFGGGRNTGRNSGIGGIIGNAAQTVVDKEAINNVYAIPGTMYDPLLTEQQIANAEYIYRYLRDRGWSLEAICGLLGNIHEESGYNPGAWEFMDDIGNGYGLAQWTDANRKFLQWLKRKLECDDNEDMANVVNNMANTSPIELMNYELEYLLETCQPGNGEWIPTTKYDCPEEMAYETYIITTVKPGEDAEEVVRNLALIFHGTYERSADEGEDLMDRAEWANRWYGHFQGTEDIRNYF